MDSDHSGRVKRRDYLRALGASSTLALVAGCLDGGNGDGSDGGDPGGDGNESDGGNAGEDGNESDGDGGDSGEDGGDGGREIVAGTAPGFAPFEMKEGGDLVGFDIDLLEAVVAETDYELSGWEEFEFDSLIPALTNEQIDVVAAAMTITEERQETIAFTDPYYSADQSVLVREGGDFQPEELSDLEEGIVGAQQGTTGEMVVEEELIDGGDLDENDYRAFGNYVLAVQDLENGNVDAVVVDEPVANTFANERDVEIAFVHETGEEYGFGTRQDDDDLTEALNEGLAAVEESSDYEDLTSEWFGQDDSGEDENGS